ncbi:MAG: hypothetical protein ACJA1E_000371 [Paracoccaceae bacterium]|jgi:hypothetical protein
MTGLPKVIQSRKSLKDSILVVSARMACLVCGWKKHSHSQRNIDTRPISWHIKIIKVS